MKKQTLSLLLLLILVLSLAFPASAAQYTDVPDNSWYAPYVSYVSEHGIFQGMGGGRFEPDTVMTRAMFVTVLHRMYGSPSPKSAAAFSDVPAGAWYAKAVAWGAENSVVRGYSETQFGSNDPVTREQMCTLLVRFAALTGKQLPKTVPANRFADEAQISGYASDAVSACQQAGVVQGMPGNQFAPRGSATRAQVAAVLTRYLQSAGEETPIEPSPIPTDHAELPIDVLP